MAVRKSSVAAVHSRKRVCRGWSPGQLDGLGLLEAGEENLAAVQESSGFLDLDDSSKRPAVPGVLTLPSSSSASQSVVVLPLLLSARPLSRAEGGQ